MCTVTFCLPSRPHNFTDAYSVWNHDVISSTLTSRSSNLKQTYSFLGFEYHPPKWIRNINDAFFGYNGIITKIKDFLSGNVRICLSISKVSTNLFGKRVNFQAKMPQTKAELTKSVSRFFLNIQSDPATRTLFIIYLNIVVFITVYALLFMKHLQLSIAQNRAALARKEIRRQYSTHIRTESPDTTMPSESHGFHHCLRETSSSDSTLSETTTQMSSINWSAMANPSVINMVSQETIITMQEPPRLLKDLEGLLSPSTSRETETGEKPFKRKNYCVKLSMYLINYF
uniref:VASt domain-containing protein n=1 Tax=Heterorhabditis bacteriophora TaxID=37862 RepID=A0A1I7WLL9_HETBA